MELYINIASPCHIVSCMAGCVYDLGVGGGTERPWQRVYSQIHVVFILDVFLDLRLYDPLPCKGRFSMSISVCISMAYGYRSQLWYEQVPDMTFGCMAGALSQYWFVVAVCQRCGVGVVGFHYETPVCGIRMIHVSGASRG